MAKLETYLLSDTAEVTDDDLFVGGVNVSDLAKEFGTPLFVYDEQHVRNRCREAVSVEGVHAAYASKAFSCRHLLQVVASEGLGVDVATGGELGIALSAGVDPASITVHGNNKSLAELDQAIEAGVGKIVIDSFDELDRLEFLHSQNPARVPDVLIRVTPGIKAETHKFISTGQDDTKFGLTVSNGDAEVCIEKALKSPAVNLLGIHSHIGSQVFSVESLVKAFQVIAKVAAPYDFDEIVVGGGIGVPYVAGEQAPSINEWVEAIKAEADAMGVTASIGIEPGRSIVGPAAMTLYEVGTIKKIPGVRNFVAVDGGMSDNPRPIMYGSGYEAFCPTKMNDQRKLTAHVVGKHCESGDIVVEDAQVPESLQVGDFLATPVTGAYGYGMASNYNGVGRPAVVFVADGDAKLVRRRETLEDMLACDLI